MVMASLVTESDQASPGPGRIVVCGGGIIGAATSFYLAQLGVGARVTLVEREGVACAASGKAGGFLALDWCDRTALRPLARASFPLHAQLAQQFGAERIGYRPISAYAFAGVQDASMSISGELSESGADAPSPVQHDPPSWVDGHVTHSHFLGSGPTVAQVHPGHLTHALVDSATSQGTTLLLATVTGLERGEQGQVTGVHITDSAGSRVLAADVVVVAMGPWSDAAAATWGVQLPRITGEKYHSVVFQPRTPVGADACFTTFKYSDGREEVPEVYPRPDGTVYICGGLDETSLPAGPAEVTVDAGLCHNLSVFAGSVSSQLQGAPVLVQQACYLPISPDGFPVIGPVPHTPGLFVATGHKEWGILNGPATGKALAELIVTGKASTVDLELYSPARFMASKMQPLQA